MQFDFEVVVDFGGGERVLKSGLTFANPLIIPKEPRIREGVRGIPLILGGKSKWETTRLLADPMVTGFRDGSSREHARMFDSTRCRVK